MLISMILNIIKMEIWKTGKLLDNEVTRFSKQKYRHAFKFEFQIGHKIFEIYLYKNIVSYLKFRLNFTSCLINGCAGKVMVGVMQKKRRPMLAQNGWSVPTNARMGICMKHTLQNQIVAGLQIKAIYYGSLTT